MNLNVVMFRAAINEPNTMKLAKIWWWVLRSRALHVQPYKIIGFESNKLNGALSRVEIQRYIILRWVMYLLRLK